MDATNLADLYGLPTLDWAPIKAQLDAGIAQAPGSGGPNRHTCWLTTINPDGSPHVTGVGALWVDDAFWFETGEQTRKAKNLARDPRCALSVATRDFDLVVEGTTGQITDPSTVAAMAARWAAEGWPAALTNREGSHRRVQCTFGRTTAVVRVPPEPAYGNGARDSHPAARHAGDTEPAYPGLGTHWEGVTRP